ncbi:MAG: hypothetical protein U9O49_03220 [Candidatus Thermoplasmatota archaeon]|nr:hypothetical protein [Candidatus Thermoplasmatota archaeon]
MTKPYKDIAIIITMVLLLTGVFSACTPSTPALFDKLADLYSAKSIIELTYDENATQSSFLPLDRVKEIPLVINYRVIGRYAEYTAPVYVEHEIDNFINLYVDSAPDWCAVTVTPTFISAPATTEGIARKISMIINVDECAEAFSEGVIKLRVDVSKVGIIDGGIFYFDVPFKPGYLPIIGTKASDNNVKSIGPDETANFKIEVENLGNAKTELICNIINAPEGWIVTINPNAAVEWDINKDGNKKETLSLVVKPPHNFGYHNDREVIQVSITPSYFDNSSLTGKEHILSFVVQNRGFSTPGFETIFVLFAMAYIVFIVGRTKKRRMNEMLDDSYNGGRK